MRIGLDVSSIQRSHWSDYAVRFMSGGVVTALTGLLAKRYGPSIAGLFLAFPAIFPAAATLIAKHEKQKKQQVGLDGTLRGRSAAGIDAAGASMGAIGLIVFATLVWRWLPDHNGPTILALAGMAWLAASVLIWWIRKAI